MIICNKKTTGEPVVFVGEFGHLLLGTVIDHKIRDRRNSDITNATPQARDADDHNLVALAPVVCGGRDFSLHLRCVDQRGQPYATVHLKFDLKQADVVVAARCLAVADGDRRTLESGPSPGVGDDDLLLGLPTYRPDMRPKVCDEEYQEYPRNRKVGHHSPGGIALHFH